MRTKWWHPLVLLALIAPWTPWLDLKISSYFYTPSDFGKGTFYDNSFFHFLYQYGELFGFIFGGIVLGIFVAAFFIKKYRTWQRGALTLILTLVVGAGLITNSLFKEYWGRPRPKQIVEFGGKYDYRPFWHPNFNTSQEPQKSFPSGHVAMGFYYLSLFLVANRYRNQHLKLFAVFLILFWGVGLMFARVAQGGHFLSDVLISPIIMWWCALLFDYLVFSFKLTGRTKNI